MPSHSPLLPFAAATELLRELAADDRRAGDPHARARLLAHRGDEALALVGLRPFDGSPVPALIEALALLLPLGADRLTFVAPARAWSLDDPIPPVCDAGDLRATVLTALSADAHDGAARLVGTVWAPTPVAGPPLLAPADEEPAGPVPDMIRLLLDGRDSVAPASEHVLAVQAGRLVVLGHELLVLAPAARTRLERATALPCESQRHEDHPPWPNACN
jgi:hypothetical protein